MTTGSASGARGRRERLLTLAFALLVAVAVYFSFEEIGFDPGFPRHPTLGDFGSFYEAGRAVLRGDNPYGVYPLTYVPEATNLNPPFAVLLFAPLGLLEPVVAARLWSIGSALAYVASVVLLLRAYPGSRAPWRLAWALGLSAVWGTLALGQIYNYLALATVGGWLLLRAGRPGWAAVLLGLLIAVKVNFAVVPVVLFAAGHRRAALLMAAAALGLSALPLAILGPPVYAEWAGVIVGGVYGQPSAATNGSLYGLLGRLNLGWLALPLAGGLILALAGWAWRRRPRSLGACAVGLAAGLLAAPVAWTGYTVFLLPVFFARRWSLALACAAGLLLVPIRFELALADVSQVLRVVVGSTYTWVWLLVLATLVVKPEPAGPPLSPTTAEAD